MSESKHTPGPWSNEATGSQPGAYSVVGDGNQMVALVYGETRDAQRANAKLITASLDLLAALLKLSNEVFASLPLMEFDARQMIGNSNYNVLMLRAEEARAAVTKAIEP